jgi:hypothetical protein
MQIHYLDSVQGPRARSTWKIRNSAHVPDADFHAGRPSNEVWIKKSLRMSKNENRERLNPTEIKFPGLREA